MLASVLNRSKANLVNISIIRAIIALRELAMNCKELAEKMMESEKKYNKQFKDVYDALDYYIQEKQNEIEVDKRTRVGFKK